MNKWLVDFSPTAIKQARAKSRAAGVEVRFVVDDLTNLLQVSGAYDLLLDVGALSDMNQKEARDLFMRSILPLTHPGSQYLLMCFENVLESDEVERRFGEHFSIEAVARKTEVVFSREIAVYLMTRR